jgi:DNA-directed RNA polymerase specialized sigma24 family protein
VRHLVDDAPKRATVKLGGLIQEIQLEESLVFTAGDSDRLLALDRALSELRVEDTAAVLGISKRTVKWQWSSARARLHREMEQAA